MPDYPGELVDADFCRLRFACDFNASCELRPGTMLRLRRPLRMAASQAFKTCGENGKLQSQQLFDPALSHDPVAVRKYQKPAPPFVIFPTAIDGAHFDVGDRLELDVLFLGTGLTLIQTFLDCLIALGRLGLEPGGGCFEVSEISSLAIDGNARPLRWRKTSRTVLSPEIHSLATYLQYRLPGEHRLRIDLLSPARLIHAGHVLKSPQMTQLFPFMMRRVTSMLHAHCRLEVCPDPQWLIDAVSRLKTLSTDWRWLDWRGIGDLPHGDNIGGVIGTIVVEGVDIEQLRWVIGLCTLFGIGKGAPYGAGHVRLSLPELQ